MKTSFDKQSGSHLSHQIPFRIPVIDLFAGPGGLGEGFSACCDQDSAPRFRVALSIEKEGHAHRTLETMPAALDELKSAIRNYFPTEAKQSDDSETADRSHFS